MMLLDCTTCPGRGTACDGCVVSVVLDPRPAMAADLAAAVDVLREAGLIGPVHLALQQEPEPHPAPRLGVLAGTRRAG